MGEAATCPFCELDEDRLVWSSGLACAFRDAYPVSAGHTLVVTRRHIPSYFDANAFEKAELWQGVEAVKAALDAELKPDGYNVGFNAGASAGQTVQHLHIHVIPRFRGDVGDPRGGVRGVIPGKQNYLRAEPTRGTVAGVFADLPSFVAGQEQHLLAALERALLQCNRADILSAFVQDSGLKLLQRDLEDAFARGVHVRLLTSDYMNITSADALRRLLELSYEHELLSARFYECVGREAFHAKAYIFIHGGDGVAYVGSSNLSEGALTQSIEWNLRAVWRSGDGELERICQRFDRLFNAPQARPLTRELVDAYSLRAPVPQTPEPRLAPFPPHAIQREALRELDRTRTEDGAERGMVVMATGLGKTYLAALDCKQLGASRALFVAHRDEILTQAMESWRRLFPEQNMGKFTGQEKRPEAAFVFASTATLSRPEHLEKFEREAFDYVVIDEFHHATATTYRRILGHFQPKFLLGMTATPDRMDGASLYELCDENLVYQAGILRGITTEILCPFRYYGVKDSVDFEPIPWRGRFDADELTRAVATRARSEQTLREYLAHAPAENRRALAFCCSTAHADHMAEYLREHDIGAVAIHSAPSSAPRAESLRRFSSGDLEVLCVVDVFNEGLDVPDINVVLMLRPTESPVIFLQQLGRGLRRSNDKEHLTIVDFIGNHRSFLSKPQALLALTGADLPASVALKKLRDKTLELPPGCLVDVELDAIDMLERVSRLSKSDLLIYEYLTLRDTHGRRPTAGELYAQGVHLKPVRQRYQTWFEFVREQGDLTDDEARILDQYADWFGDLLRTPLSKSFKMVTLQGLLDRGELLGSAKVSELASYCREVLRRDPLLRIDLREHESSGGELSDFIQRWRQMPLRVWADGRGTSRRWFQLSEETFDSQLDVQPDDRTVFIEMTEEMIDFRLREYRDKLRSRGDLLELSAPIVLRVSHSSGNPILRFNRDQWPDLPEGDTQVRINDEVYVASFRKIAVNVVRRPDGGPNVLPQLMRQWFGPSAGLPGTRHSVELRRVGAAWRLWPEGKAGREHPPTVIAFPTLPYYNDLEVACGERDPTFEGEPTAAPIHIATDRPIDPDKHFVVRAHGDSMDGGPTPIKDGDLVLCEWQTVVSAEQTRGKPYLLAGYEGDETRFAQIKVPVKRNGQWFLRSWNEQLADQPIEDGITLRPVGRVLDVVEEAEGAVLWAQYDRAAAAALFGVTADRSWQVGHRDIDVLGRPHTVLFVTLRKGANTPPEQRYADRFISRTEFQWESQASTTPESAKGRRVLQSSDEGRTVHLFVRYRDRSPFTYCGPVVPVRHEGSAPIRIWFELENELPDGLWKLWRT